jgi:hypothetical protein
MRTHRPDDGLHGATTQKTAIFNKNYVSLKLVLQNTKDITVGVETVLLNNLSVSE